MNGIIIGLGYGDEGKGLTTSFLCENTYHPLVVRFNGGHQAGHTVIYKDERHVFSNFGAGTLQNVPTYWSKNCTFYPYAFLNELALLDHHHPDIFVNPLCPVTTPFDVLFNQQRERIVANGSVGVGFGATIQRQEAFFKLHVQDLFYENVLFQKLKAIAKYYSREHVDDEIGLFLEDAKEVTKIIHLADDEILTQYNPIFEGAQGILLDQDFGFFPNVTRSNTTSKNALEMYPSEEVYYVTRTYLTRHGNGYLPNEEKLALVNNENETNQLHEYQGKFRTAELNMELLKYALICDRNYSNELKKNLVITCFDQYPIDIDDLLHELPRVFNKVFVSSGPSLTDIVEFKQK